MTLAMFKLESFSNAAVEQAPPMIFTQADLDRAFAEGAEEATLKAQDDQLRALDAALVQLARTMADDETRRAQIRSEAVQALVGEKADEEMRLTRMPGAGLKKDPAQLIDAVREVGFFPGPRVVLLDDTPDSTS